MTQVPTSVSKGFVSSRVFPVELPTSPNVLHPLLMSTQLLKPHSYSSPSNPYKYPNRAWIPCLLVWKDEKHYMPTPMSCLDAQGQ
jgi:hypothetical protein